METEGFGGGTGLVGSGGGRLGGNDLVAFGLEGAGGAGLAGICLTLRCA